MADFSLFSSYSFRGNGKAFDSATRRTSSEAYDFVNASGNIFRYYRGEREQIEDDPKGAILDLL